MTVLKRAKVETGMMELKRLKNDTGNGGKWKYVIEYPDGDRAGPWTRKRAAKKQFEERKQLRQRDSDSDGGLGGLGGLLGR